MFGDGEGIRAVRVSGGDGWLVCPLAWLTVRGLLTELLVSLTICGVVTVLVSDLFWRVVDIKSVAFARWVSVQCFVSEEEPLER